MTSGLYFFIFHFGGYMNYIFYYRKIQILYMLVILILYGLQLLLNQSKELNFIIPYTTFTQITFPKLPEFLRKIITLAEKSGIKFSDTLFLVDESRYEQVKGAKIKKLVYIYNSPQEYYPIKEKENLKNKLIIFYAGLLDRSRGLEYVIDAVKELEFTKLIIAGNGNYKNDIEKESEQNNNIIYLGWLNHDDVLEMSFQADILFAFYDPKIPNNRYASPNKLFESMMCEKPIIMNSETSASKIVQNENCGITIGYGNVKFIKDALIQLQKSIYPIKAG